MSLAGASRVFSRGVWAQAGGGSRRTTRSASAHATATGVWAKVGRGRQLLGAAGSPCGSRSVSFNFAEKDGLEHCSSCFIPTDWYSLPLLEKREHNHDSTIYTIGLPAGQSLELPVCACVLMNAPGVGELAPHSASSHADRVDALDQDRDRTASLQARAAPTRSGLTRLCPTTRCKASSSCWSSATTVRATVLPAAPPLPFPSLRGQLAPPASGLPRRRGLAVAAQPCGGGTGRVQAHLVQHQAAVPIRRQEDRDAGLRRHWSAPLYITWR